MTAFTLSVEEFIISEKFERTEFDLTSDLDKLKVGCDLVFKILQIFATNWPLDLLVPFWYVFNLLNCSFVISLEQAACSNLSLLEQYVGSIYGIEECADCSSCCLLEQWLYSTVCLLEQLLCSTYVVSFEFKLFWRPFVREFFSL